jgi:HlyD family secretion protein
MKIGLFNMHQPKYLIIFFVAFLFACKKKQEKISPTTASITESIYASGLIKSKNQYQAFSTVNGIIETVYVSEGDTVQKEDPLFAISNETQQLNKENAELSAKFSDFNNNQGKLNDAKLMIDQARYKMRNDSLLLSRQAALWKEQIGTKNELDQRELAYKNSKDQYSSAILKYEDLKKQLDFSSAQSKKLLQINSKLENDFTIRSEISGVVYSLNKVKGEIAGTQSPLAIIGDAKDFILEMQVDEFDIIQIKKGLPVLVSLESYKGQVFEASVTKINPIMNERSKSFLVEAAFKQAPPQLYPNISFEASIVLRTKDNVLLIPRNYLLNDSTVIKANGEKQIIKTGLKDYNSIEVIAGLSAKDELLKPVQ